MRVRGWPVTTISRGEVVWSDDGFRGQAGRGRFLRCDHPPAVEAALRRGA
jgi:dihydropyrimidinase